MKRIKRGIAGIFGIGIIVGILLFCSGGYGDPFSEANARRQATAYAKRLYPEQSFKAQMVYYTAPFVYTVDVQSNESMDTHFSVKVTKWVQITDQLSETSKPEHERLVESAWNTSIRIGREAAEQVEVILERELPEYKFCSQYERGSRKVSVDIGYVPEKFEAQTDYREIPEQYREFLPLDCSFDPTVLQKIPAKLSVVISWPTVPTETALIKTLRKIKRVLEKNEIPISYYHVTLLYETESGRKEDMKRIEADNVSAEQIG